jgi:tetratricopeptide (TPR) repeat protein
VVVVVHIALLSVASASAQDDVRARAGAEFAAGEAAFEARELETALAHFQRAFELAPHDAVRFNLGIVLEALERTEDALREYEIVAASAEVDVDTRDRAAVLAAGIRARRPNPDPEPGPGPDPGQEPAPEPAPIDDRAADEGGLTALSWFGIPLASIGAIGFGVFGGLALSIHGNCDPFCSDEDATDGELMRDLANMSVAVLGTGALLLAIDLLILAGGG